MSLTDNTSLDGKSISGEDTPESAPLTISNEVTRALADSLAKIQAYVPTTWVNDTEPDIDAEHLNNAEQGILRVTNLMNSAVDVIKDLQGQVTQLNGETVYRGDWNDMPNGVFLANSVDAHSPLGSDGYIWKVFVSGINSSRLQQAYRMSANAEGTLTYFRYYETARGWFEWYKPYMGQIDSDIRFGVSFSSIEDFPKTGSGFGVVTSELTLHSGFSIPAYSRVIFMNYGASIDGALLGVTLDSKIIAAFRNNGTWQGGRML